jgi:hypothetical protein
MSLSRADHSSRGVLPIVVYFGVSECVGEASIMRRPWPTRGCCAMGKISTALNFIPSLSLCSEYSQNEHLHVFPTLDSILRYAVMCGMGDK